MKSVYNEILTIDWAMYTLLTNVKNHHCMLDIAKAATCNLFYILFVPLFTEVFLSDRFSIKIWGV